MAERLWSRAPGLESVSRKTEGRKPREMPRAPGRRLRRRSRRRAAGCSASPCAGVSCAHGLVYEGRELVAESGSTEAFRVTPNDASVEVVAECGADRSGEGVWSRFVDEQAGLLGHDRLDSST